MDDCASSCVVKSMNPACVRCRHETPINRVPLNGAIEGRHLIAMGAISRRPALLTAAGIAGNTPDGLGCRALPVVIHDTVSARNGPGTGPVMGPQTGLVMDLVMDLENGFSVFQ